MLVVATATVLVIGLLIATASQPDNASSAAGDTERVSVDSFGAESDLSSSEPAISADGRFVAFDSSSTDLVPNDNNGDRDIFVHDRQTGETTRVNVTSFGVETDGTGPSSSPRISADGRFVSFFSTAENLVPEDIADFGDVFVHDRQTGDTTRVSIGSQGEEGDHDAADVHDISADGRFVAFESRAENMVPDDDNDDDDIFVRDRLTGDTTRVSVDSQGVQSNANSADPVISADGRFVSFSSLATNLVPNDDNGVSDIFIHDLQTSETTRVSVDSLDVQAIGGSDFPDLSDDGRLVAFRSSASNIVLNDSNGVADIFVHDRQTGATTRVNVDSLGAQALADSSRPRVSGNGKFVAFQSAAGNLVAGDNNANNDVFVHDRQTGETTRVSVNSQGDEASGFRPDIDADGQFVAFGSTAANLVPGDNNGQTDVFVHDRGVQPTPTPSPSPTPSPTPTATVEPTATPTPSPTPPPTGAPQLAQGDNDCDGDADSVDALKGLQHVAAIGFSQEPDCPALGGAVPAGEAPDIFGDVDCDDDVDSVDGLKILQSVAAIPFSQNEPCTDIGEPL
jgi:tricorn protease-like protein